VKAGGMSQREKLVERFRKRPKDFTWNELERLLEGFGYRQETGQGSGRKFFNEERGVLICIHQPHPRKELKKYQVNDVFEHLKQEGFL
jgi:predicted RNA binding protein YcfA (HicA-like mRNA interferase family)